MVGVLHYTIYITIRVLVLSTAAHELREFPVSSEDAWEEASGILRICWTRKHTGLLIFGLGGYLVASQVGEVLDSESTYGCGW